MGAVAKAQAARALRGASFGTEPGWAPVNTISGKWAVWFKNKHTLLVHIPVGVWLATLIFDLLSFVGVGGNLVVRLSFYTIVFGLFGALLAVPTGVLDWAEIKPDKPAWRLGLYHMMLNLVVALIFAINAGLRLGTYREAGRVALTPMLCTVIGVAGLAVSTYLGGRMVYGYGVGVGRQSKDRLRADAVAGGSAVPEEKP